MSKTILRINLGPVLELHVNSVPDLFKIILNQTLINSGWKHGSCLAGSVDFRPVCVPVLLRRARIHNESCAVQSCSNTSKDRRSPVDFLFVHCIALFATGTFIRKAST